MKSLYLKYVLKTILFFVLFFNLHSPIYAQPNDNDAKLAAYYFNKGEFEKAEEYYSNLYKKYKLKEYFDRYFDCLIYQEKYDEAEKQIIKQIKKDEYDINYKFKLAQIYEKTNRPEKADEIYENLISELTPIQNRVSNLGKTFQLYGKYDYAIETFLKGRKMMKGSYQFNIELAELYSMTKEKNKMIIEYLDLLDYSATYLKTVQAYLTRAIDFTDDTNEIEFLNEELLTRIQKQPNASHYSEMLIWFYLQKKEFKGAVIQSIALDKRLSEKGKRVYEIANICKINKAYSDASKAYKYVIEYGKNSPYYSLAVQNNLEVSFLQLTESGEYKQEDLLNISVDFENAIIELGKNNQTVGIIEKLAKIYAFYLDEPQKAENLIRESLNLPLSAHQKASLKILLGDILVVDNRIWEASLLYMQVSNEFKEEILGHEAKFKNAKVFYYSGEFDYAKAQLDVLKASTSKLIANDAMELSLFIQDNLGIDTTLAPVQMFAKAELLIQQNKFQEAIVQLDSIAILFPFHAINDDILFKKGNIYEKTQNWEKALEYYNTVVSSYSHDIHGDDAAFRMGIIYETKLKNLDKAAEYYKMILFEFSGSLYDAEARERYRKIKGV